MINLPPVGGLIPTRDDHNEGGVVRELKRLDGLVTGGAAVGVQGKDAALRGTGADGLGVRDMFSRRGSVNDLRWNSTRRLNDFITAEVRTTGL